MFNKLLIKSSEEVEGESFDLEENYMEQLSFSSKVCDILTKDSSSTKKVYKLRQKGDELFEKYKMTMEKLLNKNITDNDVKTGLRAQ